MTHRPWRTRERRTLLSLPPWLDVGTESVELPDGRIVPDYIWLEHRDFANVIALTPDRSVLCLRSYKHGPRGVTLQFPAGILHDGEEPLDGAKRELLEETGYTAPRWVSLGRFVTDSNWGGGWMHVFLALDAVQARQADHGDLEDLEFLLLPLEEAKRQVRAGEVKLLTSAAAFSLAMLTLGSDAAPV